MHIIYNESYLLTNEINKTIEKNILKFKKISIIYYNPEELNKDKYLNNCKILSYFCKKNRLEFYVSDNLNLCMKFKCKGIFLTNPKKNINYTYLKKNFKIIGRAHNQLEYSILNKKGCSTIMLSPLFYNNKYSLNQILNIVRFNLITNLWKTKICALGGINIKNINRIKMLNNKITISFKSLINDL